MQRSNKQQWRNALLRNGRAKDMRTKEHRPSYHLERFIKLLGHRSSTETQSESDRSWKGTREGLNQTIFRFIH